VNVENEHSNAPDELAGNRSSMVIRLHTPLMYSRTMYFPGINGFVWDFFLQEANEKRTD
jgi:hypothetical protein